MHIWRYGQPVEKLGDRYILEKKLGEGGMAEVLLARDERLHRKVAIKLLKDEDKEINSQIQNRFIKEAGQTVGWQHPHILRVYDHVLTHQLPQGRPGPILFYIVMEYASGGNLRRRLTPGEPYPSLAGIFTILRQICGAVHYAHTHHVIHRDIKPENILLRQPRTGSEEAVLSDFGLAVQIDATHHTFEHGGTLAYMAPEHVRNQAVPASDIFALGVTLYLLCTGDLPFHRELKDLKAVLTGTEPEPLPPSLLNPALPPELDRPILRALQADPAARYRSAEMFWDTIVAALARTQLASEPWLRNTPPISNSPRMFHRVKPVPGTPTAAMASETSKVTRTETRQRHDFEIPVRRASRKRTPSASFARAPDLSSSASTIPPRSSAPPGSGSPPMTPTPARYPGRQSLASRKRRLTLLLAGGGIGLLLVITLTFLLPLFAQSTSVALVPRSQVEQKTASLAANQVHAHQLSATSSQSATSPATGTIPAISAQGNLLFQNDTPNPITLQSITFTSKSGVAISFQGPVTIPPPYKSVPAFAVQAGAAGNIPPLDIMQAALQDAQGNIELFVKNVATFTGGANARPNAQVQQSDIGQAANPLITAQKHQAQTQLATQMQENEQVIAATLQCLPTVLSNVKAGAQATSVTVRVAVTCIEEVYDRASARTQAINLLQAQAPAGYLLSGQLTASVLGMTDSATVQIHAQGRWSYHFLQAQLNQMTLLIAGKSQAQARTLLLQQPGVADVRISGPAILPTAHDIQLQIQPGG